MFRFTLICVGKIKNPHLRALCDDFVQRLERSGRIEIIEHKDSDPHTEGLRISAAIENRPDTVVWALAEEGQTIRSADLAERIAHLRGREMLFLVGGPYGLSDGVKRRADQLLSLSPMTFTHEMARLLLLEQLYRAVSINRGSGYHHA